MRAEELNDEIDQRFGSPEDFCESVKRTLWDSDISQADLAREAGYNYGNLNRWLNLRVTPSLPVMLCIAEALERLLEYE